MPKKKITDEALDAGPAEQVADESLADEAPAPEDFDLAGWLAGVGPVRATYPLPGTPGIRLRSRTPSYAQEMAQRDDWPKDDPAAQERLFLAAHIDDPAVTADVLAGLQEHRPADFSDMVSLAIQIDSRPSNTVAPRFLPGASD